jgi:endopeptidase La
MIEKKNKSNNKLFFNYNLYIMKNKKYINTENMANNILEKEYRKIRDILVGMQQVIIKNETILLFSKNQTMKILNELIKKLNETYNNSIIELYSNHKSKKTLPSNTILNNDSLYCNISEPKQENSEINSEYNTIKINKNNLNFMENMEQIENNEIIKNKKNTKINLKNRNIKKNINIDILDDVRMLIDENVKFSNMGISENLLECFKYNPYEELKNQIILFGKMVGFPNIYDIYYLVCNVSITNNTKENEKLELLNKVFIPLDFEIITHNIKPDTIEIEKIETNKYITIFNNECMITINKYNKIIKFMGFIEPDPLNIYIRTSQIGNLYIYEKKKTFETIINLINKPNNKILTDETYNKLQTIDKDFSEIYYKNMTFVDILILTTEQFVEKLFDDYNKFLEITKISLVKLIKICTKNVNENFHSLFNTIKLLLLGNDDNIAIASLIFNLLRDKKNPNNNELVSNIIYNQLNYISQLKLKKSSVNIKNELEKIKSITTTDIDIKKQVLLSKNMPDFIKKICLEKLDELKNSNNETYKIKMYVNLLVQFPWISDTDDNIFKLISMDKNKSKEFLENIENKLNLQVYGHEMAKTKILQMLAKLISVQGSNIHPIALSGPPGVGKTKFAQCLAECLGIPFVQITLGGQNDGELLHGHGYTYSGSQPGLIVKKIVEAGSTRCIMYFDELDKCVSKNGQVNELMSILIHLTDPMTNGSFQDRFFQEITFPLNKVIFIFSFNDASKIDKILLDRMEVLEISSYNTKEKIAIANNYLLKQLCKDVGFEYETVLFDKEIMTHIIENYTYEAGVRGLKRSLENIMLKLNIDKIYQRGLFKDGKIYTKENPLQINKEIILEYLGETKVEHTLIHSRDMVGMLNGLYATSLSGGGIVPIQITANNFGNNQKFQLKLTGNHKKIMRESIIYSFTSAINLLTNTGKELFFNNYPNGLHIHTPEAATPKDGPSAGVAFTLAFLSIMLDLKINREIALTGEIDLHGFVKKVGGIRYKIQGGFKAGVKKIFLPKENKEDLEKLQKEMSEIFDETHTCEMIEHVLDVAKKVLINWNTKEYLVIV